MSDREGYKGRTLSLLRKHSLKVGDTISVRTKAKTFEGTLMARYASADDRHVVIKLSNGYNVGISVDGIEEVSLIREAPRPSFEVPPERTTNLHLPEVAVISTGGTIASRVDYRTGAVHPALTVDELCAAVPELSTIARIESVVVSSVYSENITADHWSLLTERIAEKVRRGVRGVVVTHGTDTMGYSAAALSFALLGCPVPVILVGAQRSSDRPSSDAATNLIGAVLAVARADFSGVYVAMHDGLGDDAIALHLGTRVRKNHTSRRDAFESVNGRVAAIVKGGVITQMTKGLPPREQNGSFKPRASFEKKVALVKFHPEFDPTVLDYYVSKGFRGIVLEGTGLGHLASGCHQAVKEAVDRGVLVTMTSQCIWGRVRLTVYDTGRDLLSAGVIPLDDMLSETALVKEMWVIANSTSVAEAAGLMRHNLAGECRPRRLIS